MSEQIHYEVTEIAPGTDHHTTHGNVYLDRKDAIEAARALRNATGHETCVWKHQDCGIGHADYHGIIWNFEARR